MFGQSILSLVIWVPIVAAVLVLATGADRNAVLARWIALAGALLGFVVAIPLVTGFDTSTPAMQFVERFTWIPAFNVHYHLGVDGISMPLILLNSFITVLVVIAGWQVIQDRVAQYMAAFLVMSGLINGVFAALDGILFYVFFEGMLIPLYLIIGVWGGPNRVYAAFKFFLYTLLGSLLMLVSLIYLYFQSGGSFDIQTWHDTPLGMTAQTLMFFAFLLAFGVKVPMWPVHTWLPDAHVEAPTGGSVVLAAITLKVGAYGLLRFILPIVPDASHELAWFVITLSLIAVAYIGLVALAQADMKKLIAYSSVSHLGFVMLGLFTFTPQGLVGGILQMVNHGLSTGALFLLIGMIYERRHSRLIADFGGLWSVVPVFSVILLVVTFSSIGLPGLNGFVGEFLILVGAFQWSRPAAVLGTAGIVFAAVYLLWMYQRVVFGEVRHEENRRLPDLNAREIWTLVPILVLIVWIGIYPKPFTAVTETAVAELLQVVRDKRAPASTAWRAPGETAPR
jgi:NADH-quinone oxidoreductase subunit M